MDEKILSLLVLTLPVVKAPIPGTFFWRPRLGLDLSIPTTEVAFKVHLPNKENVSREGWVVMIKGYQMGITVVGLAFGLSSAKPYPHLNPMSAYFYTNAYRWTLRHLSLIPKWIGGNGGSYYDAHKVWRRRFFYMEEFLPDWLKVALPFVSRDEWKKEELELKKFKKYAEPAFG
ncbi:jg21014, partial [Pararge aegeria aegeria]